MRHAIPLGLLCCLAFAFKPKPGEKSYEEFKPHMRVIYQSLINVFPFTFNKSAFAGKENAKLIQENLQILAEHATEIEHLARNDETGLAHMSRELARNSKQAFHKYKSNAYAQSQFYVEEVFDTCLSCHTSRSSATDSAFTVDFGRNVDWDSMGSFAKARFLSLSRQFEQALDTYETIFSKPLNYEELLQYDPFADYLILALRVKDEKERVIKTFSNLATKPVPAMVKSDLEAWLRALKMIKPRGPKQSESDYAQDLLKEGKSLMEYPMDRKGLVHAILASKVLRSYLKQENIGKAQKAETYFQLGLCELGIGSPEMGTGSGYYFEEAIRLDPKASFAKKAFALYEEGLLFGYSGSSGVQLPPDEKALLEQLRAMVY